MIKKNVILFLLTIVVKSMLCQFIEIKQKTQVSIKKGVAKKPNSQNNSLKDTDGDGIIDNVDRCPYVKGTLKNEGCPNKASNIKLKKNFDKKSQIIEKEAKNELD
jgi:hypothetical protein